MNDVCLVMTDVVLVLVTCSALVSTANSWQKNPSVYVSYV